MHALPGTDLLGFLNPIDGPDGTRLGAMQCAHDYAALDEHNTKHISPPSPSAPPSAPLPPIALLAVLANRIGDLAVVDWRQRSRGGRLRVRSGAARGLRLSMPAVAHRSAGGGRRALSLPLERVGRPDRLGRDAAAA